MKVGESQCSLLCIGVRWPDQKRKVFPNISKGFERFKSNEDVDVAEISKTCWQTTL